MNNLRKLFVNGRTAADWIEQTQHGKMNIECITKKKERKDCRKHWTSTQIKIELKKNISERDE